VTLPVVLLIILTLIAFPRGGIHLVPMLHHSLLGLLTAHAFSIIPTNLLKIWIGELRPDFFSRCDYSEDSKICKPFFHNHKLMEHGRKSFPSGHSSTAFAGLTFLALWIAGRNGAFAIGGDGLRAAGPLQSRLLRFLIAIIWLVIAIWGESSLTA
jgi:membrane-associated phospholipid phosphatase